MTLFLENLNELCKAVWKPLFDLFHASSSNFQCRIIMYRVRSLNTNLGFR